MTSSIDLTVNTTQPTWGPPPPPDDGAKSMFESVVCGVAEPIAYKPSDKLSRVCDFTFHTSQRQKEQQGVRAATAAGPVAPTSQFRVVDTRISKAQKLPGNQRYQRRPPMAPRPPAFGTPQLGTQRGASTIQSKGPAGGSGRRASGSFVTPTQHQNQQPMGGHQRFTQMRQRLPPRHRAPAEWSFEPNSSMTLLNTFPLVQLQKLLLPLQSLQTRDIAWFGHSMSYNRNIEVVNAKQPLALRPHGYRFFRGPTLEDEFLNDKVMEPEFTVVSTDQVLAFLMAAHQSKSSWHLRMVKLEGKLIIDKDPHSAIDCLTVDETSKEPPVADDPVVVNRPAELSREAVEVNQRFCVQALASNQSFAEVHPKPTFVEDELWGDMCPKLYRYTHFTIPPLPRAESEVGKKPLDLLVRAEIDAKLPGTPPGQSYVSLKVLNEKSTRGGKRWKSQLETQKGALLATEIKNNACKVGRWVAECLLSQCDTLKIGLVCRTSPIDNTMHEILNVQSWKIRDLGLQTGMKAEMCWAVVRHILDAVMSAEDGKFALVKDPQSPNLRLYRLPDEDEEGEDVTDE